MIPTPLCDAHLHLHDTRMDESMDSIKAWLNEGNALCSCATEEESWAKTIQFTKSLPHCTGALGIHPWFCDTINVGWDTRLAEQLVQNPGLVVGECGLDKHFFPQTIELQKEVFTTQILLANKYNRPLVVHCLKAWQELFALLDNLPPPRAVVIHSFASSLQIAMACVQRGYTLSVNTKAVYQMYTHNDTWLQKIPLSALLVESDAPDQVPPYTDQSTPCNIAISYGYLAKVVGISEEALSEQISQNYCRIFQSK